ncbi:MAG: DUF4878 domain-containing protein [Prevotellaceae bacterium]|jgi:hypothetical protein|nr:DUF4878 domain-containing protein [Prevotellaceae bacterium]
MKRKNGLGVFSLVAVAMFVLASCCGVGNSPASIEMSIQKEIQKGNFEKGVDLFIKNTNFEKQEDAEQMKLLVLSFKEKIEQQSEAKGGVKEVKLVKESIDEENNTATVETAVVYNDGSEEANTSDYVRVDGKWKIDPMKK